MSRLNTTRHAVDTITLLMIMVCLTCSPGCGESERAMDADGGSSDPLSTEPRIAQAESEADAQSPESEVVVKPMLSDPPEPGDTAEVAESPADTETPAYSASGKPGDTGEAGPSLDALLAKLEVPPPWLDSVETSYDTSQPWKEARLEIRRLLSFGKPETHREALKLTWIYLQKDEIGDGHEYPMYTFLGGRPFDGALSRPTDGMVWSVYAHEEFIKQPHEHTPIHSYLTLASLYTQYGEFEKAETCLGEAMSGLPDPPWRIMRQADLLAAYGDLYAAWGKIDEAKENYAKAAALYPTAKPPYGGHLLPRRAAAVQSKLDLLTFRSLATAVLRDGQYRGKALGYAGDIHLSVSIKGGRIADIQLKHEEKIDQNACVIIPQRIIGRQSLQVDGITGATVTKDAIVDGVYRALRQAGLK